MIFIPFLLLLLLTLSHLNSLASRLKLPSIPQRSKGWWSDMNNRRQFLIDLAISKRLDPFNADTWKNISYKDVIKFNVSILFPYFMNNISNHPLYFLGWWIVYKRFPSTS